MSSNPKWWRLYRRSARKTIASERRLKWLWKYAAVNSQWMGDVMFGGICMVVTSDKVQP